MDFLTALGPVFFDRPSFAILRIRGDGRTDLALGPTPVVALRQLPARPGVPAAVDERHPVLATELGLPTARPTDAQARLMAIAAIGLLSQGSLAKITDPELLEAFFDAFRAFEEKQPWRYFDSDVGVEATVIGALGRERELAILGSSGEQRGLVIYPTRGMTARMTAGDHEAAERFAETMDAIVVYFEDEDAPQWAKELVSEGLGLRHVPVIARLERGRRVPIRSDEARMIIASLLGVKAVVDEGGPAAGVFEYKGKRVEVQIAPGEGFDPEGMEEEEGPAPIHAFDQTLVDKLLAFASGLPGYSEPWLMEGALAGAPQLAMALSSYVRPLDGVTIARRAEAAGILDDEEIAWVRVQESAPLTLLEVDAVSPGRVAVTDLFTGKRFVLSDIGIARTVDHRSVILARPVEHEDKWLSVGLLERQIAPNVAREILDTFVASEGWPTWRELTGYRLAYKLLSVVSEQLEKPREAGELRNSDGEPVSDIVERFEVRKGDIDGRLRLEKDVVPVDKGQFIVTRKGNAKHPTWRRTMLATIEVVGRRVTVRAHARTRADQARAMLERAFGPDLQLKDRTEKPIPVPPGLPAEDATLEIQPMRPGPWLRLVPELEQWFRLREELGAEPTPERVQKVHRELCLLEWYATRGEDPLEDYDPERPPLDLRRLLGVTAAGEYIGPDRRFGEVGAGIPLSLVITTLAAGVENELTLGTEALDRLVISLWNQSRDRLIPREAALDVALGEHNSDPAMREIAGWIYDQARAIFPMDSRVATEWSRQGGGLSVAWGVLPHGQSLQTGPVPAVPPIVEYDPFDEEDPDPEAWLAIPPEWRVELVAAGMREARAPFGDDFHAEATRRAEVEAAIATGKPKVLFQAFEFLEEKRGSRGYAVATLASTLALEPKVKVGVRSNRGLVELLDTMMDALGFSGK